MYIKVIQYLSMNVDRTFKFVYIYVCIYRFSELFAFTSNHERIFKMIKSDRILVSDSKSNWKRIFGFKSKTCDHSHYILPPIARFYQPRNTFKLFNYHSYRKQPIKTFTLYIGIKNIQLIK